MRWYWGIITICLFGCSRTEPQPESTNVARSTTQSSESEIEVLTEQGRSYLWDVEHLGFVLERTVLPALRESFSKGDFNAWQSAMSGDCTVTSNLTSEEISLLDSKFHSVRYRNAGQKPKEISFESWLKGLRGRFDEKPEDCQVSIGLVRLTSLAGDDLSGQFSSVWRMRISGSQEAKPVELELELLVTISELDDEIADSENWLTSVTVLSQFETSAEQHFFEERTEQSGLVEDTRHDNWIEEKFEPNTGGVYVTDYDLDGHLDVLIDDLKDGTRLYQGRGDGTFNEQTNEAGLARPNHSPLWALSAWGDFDGDGDDDLINEDCVYENLGDGTFRQITQDSAFSPTPAAGYAVGDFNNDGRLDLYVCHTSAYRTGQEQKSRVKWIDDGLGIDNVLYRNDGDWQFTDVTEETNTGGQGSSCFSAVWINANGDLWPDLFAINEFGRNSLFINEKGISFTERSIDPVFGGFSMGVSAGDFDNSGTTDVYVANMYSKAGNRILANVDVKNYPKELHSKITEGTKGSKLYQSKGEGSYSTVSVEDSVAYIGWAYGPTFFDLNNDGWLDLYATAGFKSEKRGEPDG